MSCAACLWDRELGDARADVHANHAVAAGASRCSGMMRPRDGDRMAPINWHPVRIRTVPTFFAAERDAYLETDKDHVPRCGPGSVGLKRQAIPGEYWAVSDNGSTSALQAEGRGSTPLRSTDSPKAFMSVQDIDDHVRPDPLSRVRMKTQESFPRGHRRDCFAPLAQLVEHSPDKRTT